MTQHAEIRTGNENAKDASEAVAFGATQGALSASIWNEMIEKSKNSHTSRAHIKKEETGTKSTTEPVKGVETFIPDHTDVIHMQKSSLNESVEHSRPKADQTAQKLTKQELLESHKRELEFKNDSLKK